MPIPPRYKALAALGLAAGAALAARHLASRHPADPCDATPELHACALFARPDWLTRRAYAGRLPADEPASARAVETTGAIGASPALAVSAGPAKALDRPEAEDGDGV